MIWWDGTGRWLLAKTLEQGAFSWPKVQDGVMRLTPAAASLNLRGSELQDLEQRQRFVGLGGRPALLSLFRHSMAPSSRDGSECGDAWACVRPEG